ncbi:MAG: ribonuclease Z [Myxococcota bacterium]
MSQRELVVLGTASQAPTRHRNHNGVFLRWDDQGWMFDPGEGTQRQMARFGVRASSIHHLAITHFHGDHCLGVPGVVQRLCMDRVPHPVQAWYPGSGQTFWERLRHASIFDDVVDIRPNPLTDDPVHRDLGALTLTARRLDHRCETYGYRLQEPDGVRLLPDALQAAGLRGAAVGELVKTGQVQSPSGQRVQLAQVSEPRPGQSIAFVMDTRVCAAAVELARDADLLVIESTFLHSEAKLADEYGHLTARQAAEVAKEAGVRRLVLTHFSQRYPDNQVFQDEAAAVFDDVVAAVDGLRISVPARRVMGD